MPFPSFREILIVASGSTPQIISEAIYALSQQNPPIYLDEIHIITTAPHKKIALKSLMEGEVLEQLCADYNLPALILSDINFVVACHENGEEIEDIRTADENEHVGDMIASFLRDKATDPSMRLHCVLSGGRKTLSYYMGVVFQLCARQWDRLYHVMVTPEFERHPEFFYKPPVNTMLISKSSSGEDKILNTDDAEVFLVELPLIYLRDKLSIQPGSVRAMVSEGQREISTASLQLPLKVNLSDRTVYIGNTLIELPPTQLIIYAALLRYKLQACKYSEKRYCQDCVACFVTLGELASPEAVDAMSCDYKRIYGDDPFKQDELLEKWHSQLEVEQVRQFISKINRTLKDDLKDPALLPYYQVSSIRKYGNSRYGIRADKAKIIFEA